VGEDDVGHCARNLEVVPVKLSRLLIGFASLVPSVASAEILAVKTESANFRSAPSDKAAVVYSADKFYPVEVIERKSGWAKVKDFEGDTAWVAERVLGKLETVVIDTPSANIREKAKADSDVLFKVAHGEVFKVEDRKDNWLKIKDAHGDGGWIRIDKTWGQGDEKKNEDKASLDKKHPGEKGEGKSEPGESHAKTAHDEKSHPLGAKPEEKTADKKPGEMSCVCKAGADDKGEVKVAHADLTIEKADAPAKPEKAEHHKKDAPAKPAEKKPAKPVKNEKEEKKPAHPHDKKK
jgi:SH3-like domain-containing protein